MSDIYVRNKVNYRLKCLTILNAIDGIATFIGLYFGFYVELNILLSNIYTYNPYSFIIIKIILPTIVFSVLSKKLTEELSYITRYAIIIANIVYIILCLYHVILYFRLLI